MRRYATVVIVMNVLKQFTKVNKYDSLQTVHSFIHLYIVPIECYCGKVDRTIPCKDDKKDVKNYSCEQVCDKVLLCGNHNCKETCHPGECPPCVKAPDQVKCCPCGKTKLEIVRTSCLDPVPCCEKVFFIHSLFSVIVCMMNYLL